MLNLSILFSLLTFYTYMYCQRGIYFPIYGDYTHSNCWRCMLLRNNILSRLIYLLVFMVLETASVVKINQTIFCTDYANLC